MRKRSMMKVGTVCPSVRKRRRRDAPLSPEGDRRAQNSGSQSTASYRLPPAWGESGSARISTALQPKY